MDVVLDWLRIHVVMVVVDAPVHHRADLALAHVAAQGKCASINL